MAKTLFFKQMHKKYGRAENLSRLIQLDSMQRAIRSKVFLTKYLKRKHHKIFICYFYKFSVHDHLHEHYYTFEQLFGKTLTKIESAVAIKQTKNVPFCFFQNILPVEFFTTVKGIFKNRSSANISDGACSNNKTAIIYYIKKHR